MVIRGGLIEEGHNKGGQQKRFNRGGLTLGVNKDDNNNNILRFTRCTNLNTIREGEGGGGVPPVVCSTRASWFARAIHWSAGGGGEGRGREWG